VRQQATAEHQEPLSAEEKRALSLGLNDLQQYWEKEEQSRMAPRGEQCWTEPTQANPLTAFIPTVHQQGLGLEEKILRHFDLSSQYGVCP
jgi:DNA polymerase delta subunit 4